MLKLKVDDPVHSFRPFKLEHPTTSLRHLYTYNTAAQTTTVFSPFVLLYRRKPSSPLDTILPYRLDASERTTVSVASKRAGECRQLAWSFTSGEQGRQKSRFDASHTPENFFPGSLVLLCVPYTTPNPSSKLFPKCHRSCCVLERISTVNYIVDRTSGARD